MSGDETDHLRNLILESVGLRSRTTHFGWLAMSHGLISLADLKHALGIQRRNPQMKIGEILKQAGLLTSRDVGEILSFQLR